MIIDEVQSFARDFINFKSFRTSGRKAKIREAYKALTGDNIRVSCSTCYIEALMLIINSQPMASRNYELKRGVLLEAFGDASKTCTNDTLTDELAEWYLTNHPEKKIYFAKMPGMQTVEPSDLRQLFKRQPSQRFGRRTTVPVETNIVTATNIPPRVVILPPKITIAPPIEVKIVEVPKKRTTKTKK